VGGGLADADTDYLAVADEPADRWRGCHADVYALADDAERQRAVDMLGRPVDLADDAMDAEAAEWSRWQQEIALVVGASESEAEALERLQEWAARASQDEAIAGGLYRTTMQADMAGQMFVRLIEAPETVPEQTRALDARPRPSFLSMTFQEALDSFLERRIITPAEFRLLSDDAKQRAFTATRLASQQMVERAAVAIRRALETGSTLREFAAELAAESVSLGVTSADPAYVENVFRTNTASAYSAGRFRQMRSPAVIAARPFVQFRATMDSRTTTICQSLHSKVFRQDDPSWHHLAPANHFMCRSVMVVRREAGGAVTRGSDITERPMPGFDAPPAVALTPDE
jgi:SPP1 gp7 family putative phage head morphogenesis protein